MRANLRAVGVLAIILACDAVVVLGFAALIQCLAG